MHFFRGSKHKDDDGGSTAGESPASPKSSSKHKSVDHIFTLPNFLARSISRRTICSPERVPRQNEFDTPSFLSHSKSNARKLDSGVDRLSRSRSTVKRSDAVPEKVSSRSKSTMRSQSTARRSDAGTDVGSSRCKSTARRSDVGTDGGMSRSRSTARRSESGTDGGSSRSKSTARREEVLGEGGSSSRRRSDSGADMLSRSTSRKSNIPIMFSNSTARGKPPPIEKTLECSLEELLNGCVKKITITREIVGADGFLSEEQETVKIKVKPGWRQGTKITFEGKGEERPGTIPADVIFTIAEARHNVYRREGDDLVMSIEIPLVKALIGCTLSIPLLGGGKIHCRISDIVYPGYEKIIAGEGMPSADRETRGDMRIRFHVAFPGGLTPDQRSRLFHILKDSCDD